MSTGGGCVTGGACSPANVCDLGAFGCANGQASCEDTGVAAVDGTECGDAGICCGGSCADLRTDPLNCGACGVLAAGPCVLPNACEVGRLACEDGRQTCSDTGTPAADGAACGDAGSCCGGSCVKLETDPFNCGICGRACPPLPPAIAGWYSRSCEWGRCDTGLFPVIVTTGASTSITTVLAATDSVLCAIDQGATNVQCIPVDGGSVQTVATDSRSMPLTLALDSSWAYWSVPQLSAPGGQAGAILKGSLTVDDAGAPNGAIVLASDAGIDRPTALVVDATSVYWSDSVLGTVSSVPLDGGAIVTWASGLTQPGALAVGGAGLYVVDGTLSQPCSTIHLLPLDGGAPVTLASGLQMRMAEWMFNTTEYETCAFTLGRQSLVWVDGSGNLMSLPASGGSPTLLAAVAPGNYCLPQALALDDANAYLWNSYTDCIVKVPLDGGAPEEILGPVLSSMWPSMNIAVNSSAVYAPLNQGVSWIGSITPK
ncbi:MAG: hypothetical protein ACYDCL_19465 [Myxococcales bacterium]